MARASLAIVLALLALAPPAAIAAAAPQTTAPPGNSAIDEYLETVPGASGDQRPRTPAERDQGDDGSGVLTAAQRAALARQGSDGELLKAIVDETAPAPRAQRPAAGATSSSSPPPAESGRSPLAAAALATTGSDGGSALGYVLPAILLASLVAVVGLRRLRRRDGTPR